MYKLEKKKQIKKEKKQQKFNNAKLKMILRCCEIDAAIHNLSPPLLGFIRGHWGIHVSSISYDVLCIDIPATASKYKGPCLAKCKKHFGIIG